MQECLQEGDQDAGDEESASPEKRDSETESN